jgi:hypothetical protein
MWHRHSCLRLHHFDFMQAPARVPVPRKSTESPGGAHKRSSPPWPNSIIFRTPMPVETFYTLAMSLYKLRFFVETALAGQSNSVFQYQGTTVEILLTERRKDASGIEVELSAEGVTHGDAIVKAQNQILHPVLDAIAFQRHTPMSIASCARVLKAERGLKRRRAILIRDDLGKSVAPMHTEAEIEIQKILDGEMILPMRWLRHSYRSMPILDRFIFLWLALENLSGTVPKNTMCQGCQQPAICTKCNQVPLHNASDKEKAFEIVSKNDAAINKKTFNYWWGDLRNKVFHGRSEPTLELISDLHAANSQISRAVESYLKDHFGLQLKFRSRDAIDSEFRVRMHHFVEFDTSYPDEEFAPDLPDVAQIRSEESTTGTLLVDSAEFKHW